MKKRVARIAVALGCASTAALTLSPASGTAVSGSRIGPFQFTVVAHAAPLPTDPTVTAAEAEASAIANLVNVNNITGWKVESIAFQPSATQATDVTNGTVFYQASPARHIWALQLVAAANPSGQSNVVADAYAVVDGDNGQVLLSMTNVDAAPTVDDTAPSPVNAPADTGWISEPMAAVPSESYINGMVCNFDALTHSLCAIQP
ncbi:MAG TPA: hypothetical protein VFC09_09980 [Candidatus Dormibacteraeota bacterium]|nr:hypothetical protein [Candidatus Dormibacteraeota bacterium]